MKSDSALKRCVQIDRVELLHYCSALIDTEAMEITHEELRLAVRKRLRPLLLPTIKAAVGKVSIDELALLNRSIAHVEARASAYINWNLENMVDPLVKRRVRAAVKKVADGLKIKPRKTT